MNRGYHPPQPIVVTDHDVLSGRGVNIALHPGNQRFRTLVTTRADENYCTNYTASEKRAVAEEIIAHIHSLNPPGRFLKRDGRGRGLNGPWRILSQGETIKKTCQALRDCNRSDRDGYALGVTMPEDVLKEANERAQLGLSGKQQAAAAVAAASQAQQDFSLKRPLDWGRVSPSVENAAEWLKKQRRADEAMAAAAAAISDFPNATTEISPGDFSHSEKMARQRTADAMAAAASMNDFANEDHDETEDANAVYGPNDDLLGPTSASDDDDGDDAAIAEAAEVVASITEHDDATHHYQSEHDDTTHHYQSEHDDTPHQYQSEHDDTPHQYQYPSSLSASEEALAREMAAAGGLMSASLHESGGLNMHHMNEL